MLKFQLSEPLNEEKLFDLRIGEFYQISDDLNGFFDALVIWMK